MSQGELSALFKVVKDSSYDSTLASIRSDFASLSSVMPKLDFSQMSNLDIDKMIDETGMLKAGEKAGESLGDGVKKGTKKNLLGNWLGLSGEFGSAVLKASKDSAKSLDSFWDNAIKTGAEKVKTKSYGMANLPSLFAKGGPALPQTPDLMRGDFFKKSSEKTDVRGILSGAIATLFNPFVGSALISESIKKGNHKEDSVLGKIATLRYGEVFIAVKSLSLVFEGLRHVVKMTTEAIESSRLLYAKAATNGLSLQFTAKRQLAAQVMGVSELDVFRMGQAASVMQKLSGAVSEISNDAPYLAYWGQQWKIVQVNIQALGSKIAMNLLPAIKDWIEGVETIVKGLTDSLPKGDPLAAQKKRRNEINDDFVKQNSEIFDKIRKTGLMDNKPEGTRWDTELARHNKGGIDEIAKLAGLSGVQTRMLERFAAENRKPLTTKETLGQPVSFMKQLPAGAFEKMGLVIGGGIAEKSLELQRRTAMATEKLVQFASGGKGKTGSGFYMGRNPYINQY